MDQIKIGIISQLKILSPVRCNGARFLDSIIMQQIQVTIFPY